MQIHFCEKIEKLKSNIFCVFDWVSVVKIWVNIQTESDREELMFSFDEVEALLDATKKKDLEHLVMPIISYDNSLKMQL